MKLALRMKTFAMKKSYFQSTISLHALKLALNKSMRSSDDEQGIDKLALTCLIILAKWICKVRCVTLAKYLFHETFIVNVSHTIFFYEFS